MQMDVSHRMNARIDEEIILKYEGGTKKVRLTFRP